MSIHDSYELQIDDEAQTIQGVRFDDVEDYRDIRFAVKNEVLEGWKPSKTDILWLKEKISHPDPETTAAYHRLFGDD